MAGAARVFISYRREDCMVHAGRLAENLHYRAGAEVFLDVASIPPGVNFPDYIAREIAACDVVLVMIGDEWLTLAGRDGTPRIADPRDWVHIEIAAALDRGVLTIPVLVEGVRMPRPDDLPEPIANLALRNAVELRDSSWPLDFERLERALPEPGEREASAQAPEDEVSWPARFTDHWFATNVRGMDDGMLRALRAELYRRSWSDDEIAERVLAHAQDSVPTAPRSASDAEESPDSPADEPAAEPTTAFPSRFSDSWFAANVPGMEEAEIARLVVELRRRNWTDSELAERVLVHAAIDLPTTIMGGGTDMRPGGPHVEAMVVSGEIDRDDPVAQATVEAAEDLASAGAEGVRVRERHLADALARHLGAVAERRLHVPGWDPQPGNVDAFTSDRRGRPVIVIETKLKEGDQVFECLWDMAKMLSLATEPSVERAYLVTGSTVASWRRPVACAELFVTGRHELVGAIRRYEDWWIKYILGDSRGRPSAVPDLMDVEVVAAVQYPMGGLPWELRSIRISVPAEATWIPFRDGLPNE